MGASAVSFSMCVIPMEPVVRHMAIASGQARPAITQLNVHNSGVCLVAQFRFPLRMRITRLLTAMAT